MTNEKFPTDRVLYFSDAIFAIAITLLVLEIKLPTSEEMTSLGVQGFLSKSIPRFIGFLVSFLVTALYWKAHMSLGKHVKETDGRLLWINLWLLLFVVLMPFSTAFFSNNFGHNGSFIFYCLNLVAIGACMFWMTTYVIKNNDLVTKLGREATRYMKRRAIISPIIFLFCVGFVFISPLIARFGFLLIFIFQAILDRSYKKKLEAAAE